MAIIDKSGTISADETWVTGQTYHFPSDLLVNNNALVIIEEGAFLKSDSGFAAATITLGDGAGAGYIEIQGADGDISVMASSNDDTIGDTIPGSTGEPKRNDVKRWVDLAHANSTITGTYTHVRHGGDAATDYVFNNTVNGNGCFFENSVFEQCGRPIFSGSATLSTFVNLTECVLRQNNAGSKGFIQTATGQLTHVQLYDNTYSTTSQFYNVFFTNGSSAFAKNVMVETGQVGYGVRIDNDANAKVSNCTITGSSNVNAGGIISFGAADNIEARYNIVTGFQRGFYQISGTISSSYNCACYNTTANWVGAAQGTGDVEIDPDFAAGSSCRYVLSAGSPLHVVTPDKVGDVGWEHLIGRVADDSGRILQIGDDIPAGFCHKAAAVVAVDIDQVIKESGTRAVSFVIGQTVEATGNIESPANSVGVDVDISVYDFDNNLLATLYNGTTDLIAATPKTFAAIAGADLEWISTQGDRYVLAVVSGGSPKVGITVDGQAQFTVQAAAATVNRLPYKFKMTVEKNMKFKITKGL